jgi:TPR repeat protein/ankyrin repeat protein
MYQRLILSCLALGLLGHEASADGLFSDSPSPVEREFFAEQAKNAEKALVALKLFDKYSRIQQMQAGNCDPAIETEGKANANDVDAQLLLGQLFFDGLCVQRDPTKAFEWTKKAADQGNLEAKRQLAQAYEQGLGAAQDPAQAARYMKEAAEGGDAVAMGLLAVYLIEGRGVPKNPQLAISWLQKAADSGDYDSASRLGLIYLDEKLTAADPVKALKYSLPAAEHGTPFAQAMAGFAYLAQNNLIEGHKWLNIAAASSIPAVAKMASAQRDKIEPTMTADELAKARALASEWKPKTKDDHVDVFSTVRVKLPDYDADKAQKITKEEATAELKRLGIPITKEAFLQTIKEDKFGAFVLFHRAGASLETIFWPGGLRPLYLSVDYGSDHVFEYLLEHGAQVDAVSEETGQGALTRAVAHDRIRMANILLDKGATAKQPPEWRGGGSDGGPLAGGTPLAYALWSKKPDVDLINRLFSAGASTDERYSANKTPLEYALEQPVEVVNLLLQRGADPNAEDAYHQSILWHAVTEEHVNTDAFIAVLKAGADVDWPDNEMSPFLLAVWLGKSQLVSALIDAGAQPDMSYKIDNSLLPVGMSDADKRILGSGGSALMLAASRGNAAVCQTLIRAGADPARTIKYGDKEISANSLADAKGDPLLKQALAAR